MMRVPAVGVDDVELHAAGVGLSGTGPAGTVTVTDQRSAVYGHGDAACAQAAWVTALSVVPLLTRAVRVEPVELSSSVCASRPVPIAPTCQTSPPRDGVR